MPNLLSAATKRLAGAASRTLLASADLAARRTGTLNPFDVTRIVLEELSKPDASGADFFNEVQGRVHAAGFRWSCGTCACGRPAGEDELSPCDACQSDG
jgi:hypothetical protein